MASETTVKIYQGSCHCGAFRYELKAPEITQGRTCNCSLCVRKGYVWMFAPSKEAFEILSGEDKLSEYTFGNKVFVHKSCSICGIPAYATMKGSDRPPALNDLDIWALELSSSDGQSRTPPYTPPPAPHHDLVADPGQKIYTGSCHCGAVKIAMKHAPLPEARNLICNCSICVRTGRILTYPTRRQVQIFGSENLGRYQYGYNVNRFCRICGVPVDLDIIGPPADVVKDWSDSRQRFVEAGRTMQPINIRLLEGVEWAGQPGDTALDGDEVKGVVKVKRADGRSIKSVYELETYEL